VYDALVISFGEGSMNCKLWPLAFCILVGAQSLPIQVQAASFDAKLAKLDHMDYYFAREKILAAGWKPLIGGCNRFIQETCAHFPEVDVCSGVAPGYCSMVFVKEERCLYVGTSGGEPQADVKYGDTHIDDVTFRPAPCSKSSERKPVIHRQSP
jgi:hypothetical protein